MYVTPDMIADMKPYAEKLIASLKKKNIHLVLTDGDLPNVVATYEDKVCKIAHRIFYRSSGIACLYNHNDKESSIEIIVLTDEMFMMNYMSVSIELNVGTMVIKKKEV